MLTRQCSEQWDVMGDGAMRHSEQRWSFAFQMHVDLRRDLASNFKTYFGQFAGIGQHLGMQISDGIHMYGTSLPARGFFIQFTVPVGSNPPTRLLCKLWPHGTAWWDSLIYKYGIWGLMTSHVSTIKILSSLVFYVVVHLEICSFLWNTPLCACQPGAR